MMEGSFMKRKELIDKVVCHVTHEMTDWLLSGMDRMATEVILDGGVVEKYIHEVPASCEITDVQVVITHDDNEHTSPLLEKAIIEALPDWYNVKHTMEREGWLIA